MKQRPPIQIGCALALVGASVAGAGPITTVPWNGHTGAVSFTYDDARKSQIPTLLPQLDVLSIKATFFLTYGAGGDLSTNKSAWIQASKNGHELANHTYDHVNVSDGNTSIKMMANELRGFDPSVEAVTFAYPSCAVGGKNEVAAEAFMGRGCGSASYAWDTQPTDWTNIQGLILQSGAPGPGVTAIGGAKTNNTWVTTIVHDVTGSPDQYSLTPADNKSLLDAALAAKVWIAPYGTVGAYYRAHFTMDALTVTGSSPWKLTWKSPHPKMPKSVKLRVKLAAATFGDQIDVYQGGTRIQKESDGSYVIDFMKLSMDVQKAGSSIARSASVFAETKVVRLGSRLEIRGLPEGRYEYSLRSLTGRELTRGTLNSHGAQDPSGIAAEQAGTGLLLVLRQTGARPIALAVSPSL